MPEETPVNFAKFLRTPLLQNNSGRLLLKCGHCKKEAREIECLCCSDVHAMLIASTKSQSAREPLTIQLLWASVRILVTRVSLICLVDELSFWVLV